MLEIKNIDKHFGGLKAVNNANLKVKKGSITGLIGRNEDIKSLEANLENERIPVTAIVAPGGMGKTALALELLARVVLQPKNTSWCDGVVFATMKTEKLTSEGTVKLEAAETLDELKCELALTMTELFDVESEDFDSIVDELKDKKILLFLDNLETLLRDNQESFEELNESFI